MLYTVAPTTDTPSGHTQKNLVKATLSFSPAQKRKKKNKVNNSNCRTPTEKHWVISRKMAKTEAWTMKIPTTPQHTGSFLVLIIVSLSLSTLDTLLCTSIQKGPRKRDITLQPLRHVILLYSLFVSLRLIWGGGSFRDVTTL